MAVRVDAPAPARLPHLRGGRRRARRRGSRSSTGRNGAGKTNLLEALYFGCTGRSCRTRERARGRALRRAGGARRGRRPRPRRRPRARASASQPGEPKRMTVDGAPVERLLDVAGAAARQRLPARPPGARQGRRRRCAARTSTSSSPRCGRRARRPRRAYAQALAQRNALLARVRAGARRARGARHLGPRARAPRARAARRPRRARSSSLRRALRARSRPSSGSPATAELRYRPRSQAATPRSSPPSWPSACDSDLERGFTGHGPHRDDLALLRDGRELRAYGSQGEQRLALLALLLAERDALAAERGRAAAAAARRRHERARRRAPRAPRRAHRAPRGQSVVTTTDLAHVPGADDAGRRTPRACDGGASAEEALARMRRRRAPRRLGQRARGARRPARAADAARPRCSGSGRAVVGDASPRQATPTARARRASSR